MEILVKNENYRQKTKYSSKMIIKGYFREPPFLNSIFFDKLINFITTEKMFYAHLDIIELAIFSGYNQINKILFSKPIF